MTEEQQFWLATAKRIQALAQAGLTFSQVDYDLERYEELRALSVHMMARLSGAPPERIRALFTNETGYQTPKVDVRAIVLRGGRVLMVQEKSDGCWALPGGWADVGYSPREVAVKEVEEEAGLVVRAQRLLGIVDKHRHPYPPSPYHTYKVFIQCAPTDERAPQAGMETRSAGFFDPEALPPLSMERNLPEQIRQMVALAKQEEPVPYVD